ncbi:TPA: hypothetical protein ACY3XX_001983 [Yersinia enterocolitica]|uniref:Uncharacterized protein n=2 Tax=Yersinia enterocolitica TaxID=630 RepID=A0A7T9XU55_YEREN|nr:hypothetical protein [Yersinia enterocolitica]QQU47142.1 hypothetical protein I6I39_20100 [Yersinia enterocolitica]CFW62439.1 Uncharacterised protein [Yersinia enterocolitica]CND31217.1 Uncharacterised protein [Yersinia enterocolitica]CNE90213.1 Uncharacterised protein [Yersinia enterocolitica]CNH97958.1 Uncharacterised protein [Yersinia enterocolitica]
MNENEYNTAFGVGSNSQKSVEENSILLNAFKEVADIRKFEIELYWKRTTYFWTLISVAFAGYFAITSAKEFDYRFLFSLVIASMGLVFTCAWFFANKGSKFWQENWENHLDLLEDGVTGPLYKTVVSRAPSSEKENKNRIFDQYITGPGKYSVSKINQWVGLFVIFIWVGLCIFSLSHYLTPYDIKNGLSVLLIILIPALAFLMIFFMAFHGHTHKHEHEVVINKRKTTFNDKEK